MWWKHLYFKYITGFILLLIAIYFLNILHFFNPIKVIVGTLFYPILIAGFLYYVLKPFVRWIRKFKFMPEELAILTVFGVIAGAIYVASLLLAEKINTQLSDLTNKLPEKLKQMTKEAEKTIEQNDMGMLSIETIRQKAGSYFGGLAQGLGENLTQIVSTITGATTVIVIVPFVLFYFLKDDHRFVPFMMNFIPEKHVEEGKKVLQNIDEKLSAYIFGQITVAFVDAALIYIAYLIIGLDYALILAIFVAITSVVPFFGPIIGIIPALVISLTQDPAMALYVLIALVIVQQLEGNLVAPLVLGNRLNIHPLTIILLLIVAAALYGFIGMLIAIPLYAVLKVTIINLYSFYTLRRN
ncbi:AI-2E family transporter [Pontibacillus yanchengensis]|uniref:AI-2E family transporter n=1 Tax=Pontibacillus yanchengensis TaxID=462910 RepID=A0ACC7VIV1_9BACI|nr:AI-2E family transporter [Pontibacillus yanchengensis]